jgi:hypothetical protein
MTLRDFIKKSDESILDSDVFSILDADIFIDCLEGDKFLVSDIEFKGNSLTMKLHKGSRQWIKISEHY